MKEIERLKRRLSREQAARKKAESLLEEERLALSKATQSLIQVRDQLEKRVHIHNKELQENKEQFGRFIESAGDIIYQTDIRGRFTYVNPVALNVLRLTNKEDGIGVHFTELVDPQDRKHVFDFYKKQFARKERDTYLEFRLNIQSDKEVWIGQNVQLVFKEEQVVGFQSLARNITDRKNVESKLNKQRDFAEQVLINMGQGLTLTNAENRLVYVNPAYAHMLGYKPSELEGKSRFELVRPEDMRTLNDAQLHHHKGGSFACEIHLIAKDGRHVPVLITGTTRWHKEEATGYIDTITDLTERKQMEEVLRAARDQALEASRLKSEFLANMSHEIRTPLNGVIGMSELLADTTLSKSQKEFLEIINTSGNALLSIINEILDFSKIVEGKINLEHQPFNLTELIESALDMLAPAATRKKLELAYVMDQNIPNLVIGDAIRLRQIFVNLLSNAVKFTATGEVILTVSHAKALNDKKQLQFSVRDTGIGIPKAAHSQLFKAFSQVDASTTREYGGTGLGLAISRELCQLMGGDMWVESEEREGAIFHFTMDLETPQNYTISPTRQLPELVGKSVLIVDDNAIVCQNLVSQTQLWGMNAKAAVSGQEALSLLNKSEEQFDLAIIDMVMSKIDGHTLAREIRQLNKYAKMPLVLLSPLGHKTMEITKDLFAATITKPVKTNALRQLLQSVCTFNIVPSETKNHALKEAERDQNTDNKSRLKILLAEDNEANRDVVSRMLGRLGYKADTAVNGREAIVALEQQHYDLILMDIQMPEMDGLAATKHIRKHWPSENQPFIVALTASAIQGDKERFLAAGMNEYLSKPLHMKKLTNLLQKREATLSLLV